VRHDECHVTQRIRLIENPDNDHLARGMGDSGGLEGVGRFVRIARHELGDALILIAARTWRRLR
jgi:hypothetical protein